MSGNTDFVFLLSFSFVAQPKFAPSDSVLTFVLEFQLPSLKSHKSIDKMRVKTKKRNTEKS